MAQRLTGLAAVAQALSKAPSTHVMQLTKPCNSSSGGSDVIFWSPENLHSLAHTPTQTNTHTCIVKVSKTCKGLLGS